MSEIIRAYERTAFKRCRRAWDFGSRPRQNYEPLVPAKAFDLEKAVHDALALWYFPGMWEWDRSLVRGFAMEGFHKSMRKQLDAYAAVADVSEAQDPRAVCDDGDLIPFVRQGPNLARVRRDIEAGLRDARRVPDREIVEAPHRHPRHDLDLALIVRVILRRLFLR